MPWHSPLPTAIISQLIKSLILASNSPFRAKLLSKLGLEFTIVSPGIDEHPFADETPQQLVLRLSEQKAHVVSKHNPDALIIGSDQVAVLDGNIKGKPGNHQNARAQLLAGSGKTLVFFTGLALLNSKNGHMQSLVEPFTVSLRELSEAQIDFYLEQEKPYQCAGSFKAEGLGISLFSKLSGDDPSSLIGLPLIKLTQLLAVEGIDVLQSNLP